MANNKLELTWIGKDIQPNLEARILIEEPDKSYGDRSLSLLKDIDPIKCMKLNIPSLVNVINLQKGHAGK